jgi:hypothetical protein
MPRSQDDTIKEIPKKRAEVLKTSVLLVLAFVISTFVAT